MSVADPLWLLALALLPLALIAQRLSHRRTRTYAVRFPAAATLRQALAEGADRRLRRHLAVGALLAALACLAVALAAPRVTHRVPIRAASLMLVLDHSGSMDSNDVSPTRLQAAMRAANTFIDQLPASARVGVVAFSTAPDTVQQPTTDHRAARTAIDSQQANGGTATGPALLLSLQLLHGAEKHHPPAAIVLLSDGAANLGISPVTVAQEARREHIPIYTVALGTPGGVLNEGIFGPTVPVPPDPGLMQQIAQSSGGRAYDARTEQYLRSVYQTLGRSLSTVARKRDISIYFLIAAGVLLIAATLGSVRTAARLP
ncbi:MAG TPA: VWA domain-containing protein [Solirubrobacteraceae bacterium]|jgi:Ca-activated chloride channel family protein|nr:VWA domain-containing protein [Solirubrobacteraceae bacterium]